MSVTRFSEAVGYVPDLNGCRKKIVEYCRDSENTIDRLVEENAELREALKNLVASASENEEQLNDVLMCSDYGESEALCKARQLLSK